VASIDHEADFPGGNSRDDVGELIEEPQKGPCDGGQVLLEGAPDAELDFG